MMQQPDYTFETGIYRPPSEGGSQSLLVRFTRNCPWNRCTFCHMYKEEKFKIRGVAEIKQDIDNMAAIGDRLQQISQSMFGETVLSRDVVNKLIEEQPGLWSLPGFGMLLNWFASGAKTAFLQDANSLIMRTEHLVDVLNYLRGKFPSIERVTTYARAKTLSKKSDEDLLAIRKAGLDRLHVGLESGDDEVLALIKKGVTSEEQILAGQKALTAGFQLSEYWMPGLGGQQKWEQHARNTARVLNEINPHYVRSRPFFPLPGTPIQAQMEAGEFQMLTQKGYLKEIRLLVELLTFNAKLCFDHAANHWTDANGDLLFSQDYEGYQFPDFQEELLALIDEGLSGLQ